MSHFCCKAGSAEPRRHDSLGQGIRDHNIATNNGDDVLSGGAGDDKLQAGRGTDTLEGGPGEDDLDGERGNDHLITSDGQAEHSLQCGQGNDTLDAERVDAVALDCEQVNGGPLPVARSGGLTLRLECPSGCSGSITIVDQTGSALGAASFGRGGAVAARRVGPTARLNARGRRLLQRKRSVRARLRISARTGSGQTRIVRGRYVFRARR